MKLPFSIDINAALGEIGQYITQGELRLHVLKLLLTMIFIAIIWPYFADSAYRLWDALDWVVGRPPEMNAALELVGEIREREIQQEAQQAHTAEAAREGAVAGNQPTEEIQGQRDPYLEQPSEPPEVSPLTSLEQLLSYESPGWGQGFAPVRPRPFVAKPFPPLRNRLLVCHDLAGGYGEDRWVQGGGYDRAYRMYDWGLIDIFVYFSHNLVVIPTAGWTDVAHRHGTRVLGTFITEWEEGYDICAKLLQSKETVERAAMKLAQIAVDYGFDGWLVNIENKVDSVEKVDLLVHFVRCLTTEMRSAKAVWHESTFPHSSMEASTMVLWYDSVTTDGSLRWQNILNKKNRVFFDACDGIFTNYHWARHYPSDSALEAAKRRLDVYMGIDVFGRGTWGGGQFHVDSALGVIRRAGVSAALFAPAWTLEDKTSGGGQVDPEKGLDWREVEKSLGKVDGEFWAKIAAAWHSPRPLPGPLSGSGDCAALPLVVNFGCGVGNVWRIGGKEAAVFGAMPAASSDGHLGGGAVTPRLEGLVGEAFYDLASQCLTPLLALGGAKGAATNVIADARRLGMPSSPPGGANGTVGASYTFDESFDGGSSLSFTGLLAEKATATFPLFSCDVPLPAEPLEVRVTFSANENSEIALVLVLGGAAGEFDEVTAHREVVLRGWGQEGPPANEHIFSKRLAFSERRAVYSPAQEHNFAETAVGRHDDEKLQLRVRALREAGESYDSIWSRLRSERAGQPSPKEVSRGLRGGADAASPARAQSPTSTKNKTTRWITRKFIVRDLRMGGFQAVREIRLVCTRRKEQQFQDDEQEEIETLRIYRAGGLIHGIAALATYRVCLGELTVGPWRKNSPCTFGKIGSLRAVEVAYKRDENGDGTRMDLSLEWEFISEQSAGRANRPRLVSDADGSWRTLHCDLWRASEVRQGGWRWLGRAYGTKYRLHDLKVKGARAGLVLAVQQVNAMGYREAERDWARINLTPI